MFALVVPRVDCAHLRRPHLGFLTGSQSWGSRHLRAHLCWMCRIVSPACLAVEAGYWLGLSERCHYCGLGMEAEGRWVFQSVKCLTSAQVMISLSVSSSPTSGSVQTVQSLEPALDSGSPSLCPSLLACSLSQINK